MNVLKYCQNIKVYVKIIKNIYKINLIERIEYGEKYRYL